MLYYEYELLRGHKKQIINSGIFLGIYARTQKMVARTVIAGVAAIRNICCYNQWFSVGAVHIHYFLTQLQDCSFIAESWL